MVVYRNSHGVSFSAMEKLETVVTTSLPATNADGLPIPPMSDEQKYIFDLKGWICLPGLLSPAQAAAIREHFRRYLDERDALPPHERDPHGGPAQVLLDHPA